MCTYEKVVKEMPYKDKMAVAITRRGQRGEALGSEAATGLPRKQCPAITRVSTFSQVSVYSQLVLKMFHLCRFVPQPWSYTHL